MSRLFLFLVLTALVSTSVQAQDLALEGFNKRFSVVKDEAGKVTAIKLKKVVSSFSIKPFIDQIKNDILDEQKSFMALNDYEKEAEIDEMLEGMGLNSYLHVTEGSEEAQSIKESLMNIKNINVDLAFHELNRGGFWKEFESKLKEAFLFIDPTVLTNHQDARFFYKRQVTYKVVTWALDQAKKRFSQVPILNIASFVIVRVHDMMLEQRYFHHNMLLHYFETIHESKLGMTKVDVDLAISSIYEYRIGIMAILESNKAVKEWSTYGINNFYQMVRNGNTRIRTWNEGKLKFQNIKKLNFGFAQVTEENAQRIYHTQLNAHTFSSKPALAFDFAKPNRVKRNRALLNLAGVALGFINMPGWIKSSADNFIKSFYVEQVRMEGALVGHFESTANKEMISRIYSQRENFYILE